MSGKRPPSSRFKGAWAELMCQASKQSRWWYRRLVVIILELSHAIVWRSIKSLENKKIFIEEFSMVPNKRMTKIYEAFLNYNNEIFMFGDKKQCDPITIQKVKIFTIICLLQQSNQCVRIEKTFEYDQQTHKMLSTFLKHEKVSHYFEKPNMYYKNISNEE